MSLWTMKEVMRMTGITENALRYYKSKEVLAPTVQENSGRRQWLYDDSAVERLKKLVLLKFIRVPINEAGKALDDESTFREFVMSTLEELRKERDRIDVKIFVAETLAVASGEYLISTDEADERQVKILNEVIREVINSNADV